MARLIYAVNMSLDGYATDADGSLDWGVPSEEVHQFWNDVDAQIVTHLYGRRLYETMRVWQSFPDDDSVPAVMRDYGRVWRNSDKVVYSSTLAGVETPRTRLERRFDPDAVRALVAASETDVSVGGSTLAASALRAGLVDEIIAVVVPHLTGGGLRAWPDGFSSRLEPVAQRIFANGSVMNRFRVLN